MTDLPDKFKRENMPVDRAEFLRFAVDEAIPALNEEIKTGSINMRSKLFWNFTSRISELSQVIKDDFSVLPKGSYSETDTDIAKAEDEVPSLTFAVPKEDEVGVGKMYVSDDAWKNAFNQDGSHPVFQPCDDFATNIMQTVLDHLDITGLYEAQPDMAARILLFSALEVHPGSGYRADLVDRICEHNALDDLALLKIGFLINLWESAAPVFGNPKISHDDISAIIGDQLVERHGIAFDCQCHTIWGGHVNDHTNHYVFTNTQPKENGLPPVFLMIGAHQDGTVMWPNIKTPEELKTELWDIGAGVHVPEDTQGYDGILRRHAHFERTVSLNFKVLFEQALKAEHLSDEEKALIAQARDEFSGEPDAPGATAAPG